MEKQIEQLSRYNFWGESSIELGYIRHEYLDKLYQYCGNKLVKVLVGQRRAGKSYILRQLANRLIESGTDKRKHFHAQLGICGFRFCQKLPRPRQLV
jgi:predicted AAA+ superfamily ATPase